MPSVSVFPPFAVFEIVTLSDGTQKEIQYLNYDDELLVWDFFKGEYTKEKAFIIYNHGEDLNTVISLTFEDGTNLEIVTEHGVYDLDLNKFVSINSGNVADYVGHKFPRMTETGYIASKLVNYTIKEEYIDAYSILTEDHYNCMLNNMLTITPHFQNKNFFDYLDYGNDMKYDEVALNKDIETYGLYTYAEMSEWFTKDQYDKLNLAYFKIAVGKGKATLENIKVIAQFIPNN